jgi:hypothetical protein
MSALTDVATLKQQAIALLLDERQKIDLELEQLGYGKENAPTQKRRGRRPKVTVDVPPDLSCSSESIHQ